jgi:hypothetical protein
VVRLETEIGSQRTFLVSVFLVFSYVLQISWKVTTLLTMGVVEVVELGSRSTPSSGLARGGLRGFEGLKDHLQSLL